MNFRNRISEFILVLGIIIYICDMLEILRIQNFLFLDPVRFVLLALSLYQFNLPKVAFKKDPSLVLQRGIQQSRLIAPVCCTGLAFAFKVGLDAILGNIFQFELEPILFGLGIIIFGTIMIFIVESLFSSSLLFYEKEMEKREKYEWMLGGFLITSIFLAIGGDFFIDSAILLTLIIKIRPITEKDRLERNFWVIWKKAKENPEQRLLFSAYLATSFTLAFNMRFFDPYLPIQDLYIFLIIVPMLFSYLALGTLRQEKQYILLIYLPYFVAFIISLGFPDAMPLNVVSQQLLGRFSNLEKIPWISTFFPYAFVAITGYYLINANLTRHKEFKKARKLEGDLVFSFLSKALGIFIFSGIFEFMSLEQKVAELSKAQYLNSINSISIFRFMDPLYLNLSAVSGGLLFGAFFLLSLSDLRDIYRLIKKKKRSTNIKKRYAYRIFIIFCFIGFSVAAINLDVFFMSKSGSNFYGVGQVEFQTEQEGWWTYVEVIKAESWILVNASPLSGDVFRISIERGFSPYSSVPLEQKEIQEKKEVVQANISNDAQFQYFVILTLQNDTDSVPGGKLLFEVYRGRPLTLSGGPLSAVPLPLLAAFIPTLYVSMYDAYPMIKKIRTLIARVTLRKRWKVLAPQ